MPTVKKETANKSTSTTKKRGRANAVDEYIGMRLRQRRSLAGMTQEKLADSVGLTFQQIQKYENGVNRVSAGRLFEFSNILEVPVTFFFEKFTNGNANKSYQALGMAEPDQTAFDHQNGKADIDILQQKETLELIRVYYSIKNPKLRKDLFNFVKSMADNLKSQDH